MKMCRKLRFLYNFNIRQRCYGQTKLKGAKSGQKYSRIKEKRVQDKIYIHLKTFNKIK